jgi:hypothetical protein
MQGKAFFSIFFLRSLVIISVSCLAGALFLACEPKTKTKQADGDKVLSVKELRESFLGLKNCSNSLSSITEARLRCQVFDTMSLIELTYNIWKMSESLKKHLTQLETFSPDEQSILQALNSTMALGGLSFSESDLSSLVQSQFDYLISIRRGEVRFLSHDRFQEMARVEAVFEGPEAEAMTCQFAYSESEEIRIIKAVNPIRVMAELVKSGRINQEAALKDFRLGEFNLLELDRILSHFRTLSGPFLIRRKLMKLIGEDFGKSTDYAVFKSQEHTQLKVNCLLAEVFGDEQVQIALKNGHIKGLWIGLASSDHRGESVQIQSFEAKPIEQPYTHGLVFPSMTQRDINTISSIELKKALIDASQK